MNGLRPFCKDTAFNPIAHAKRHKPTVETSRIARVRDNTCKHNALMHFWFSTKMRAPAQTRDDIYWTSVVRGVLKPLGSWGQQFCFQGRLSLYTQCVHRWCDNWLDLC